MKKLFFILCALGAVFSAGAQNYVLKTNGNPKEVKEDSQNVYHAGNISYILK